MKKINSPFSNNYFLGYASRVGTGQCDIHFPDSKLLKRFWHNGNEFSGGIVGNYVVIEGERHGFLGVIKEVGLPVKEIEAMDTTYDCSENATPKFHPEGSIEILLSFDYLNITVKKGLDSFPIAGSKIYLCPPDFLTYILEKAVKNKIKEQNSPKFSFASLSSHEETPLPISPQTLFGRHCAIVGSTGGGKSYTIAQLIEQITNTNNELLTKNSEEYKPQKVILVDATGEFHKFAENKDNVEAVYFGEKDKDLEEKEGFVNTYLAYHKLRISDMIAMFRPSGQSQEPKLKEAIKSLKLLQIMVDEKNKTASNPIDITTYSATIDGVTFSLGTLIKAEKPKDPITNAFIKYKSVLENTKQNKFPITALPEQIKAECISSFVTQPPISYGKIDNNALSYVTSLVTRIEYVINEPSYDYVFGFQPNTIKERKEFDEILNEFLTDKKKSILMLSLKNVSFEFGLREILVNAIGELLLEKARHREFIQQPIILFLDEAHQFLSKSIKDDYFTTLELNAFDKIAKECRKHGLYLCISTQMPRDIPDGTLSQMGTFIVHRLINEKDKEKIKSACSEANRYSLSYLPVLGEGQALLVSVSLPMPVIVQIKKPTVEPNSDSPVLFKVSQPQP